MAHNSSSIVYSQHLHLTIAGIRLLFSERVGISLRLEEAKHSTVQRSELQMADQDRFKTPAGMLVSGSMQ
jgi:hypothetical protein